MNPERETIVDPVQLKQHALQEKAVSPTVPSVQIDEEKKQNPQLVKDEAKMISDDEKAQAKLDIEVLSSDEKKRVISEIKVTLKKTIDIADDLSIMLFDIISNKDNERTQMLFTRLTNVLATLKGQLSFIFEFLTLTSQISATTEAVEDFARKYIFLGAYSVPAKTLEDVCFQTLEYVLNFLLHVRLADLITAVHNLFQREKGVKVSEIIDTLQIVVGKVEAVIDYIPHSVCFGKEDIFALDKKGPRWETLQKFINHIVIHE